MNNYLINFKDDELFDRNTLFAEIRKQNPKISDSTFCRILKRMLDSGEIVRAGRNIYYKPTIKLYSYDYTYSNLSEEIANYICQNHSMIDFRIFETVQLNEFLNHQIGKNIIMLYVEEALEDFLFEELREKYRNVLIKPTKNEFHKYWNENMIVIQKLPTESPRSKEVSWHTCMEKMLVDIMSDKLIADSFSESELDNLYYTIFNKFAVNESKMFRYAKRRKVENKLRVYLKTNTDVKLKVD